MSKIKVNQIEAATGSTITVPSGQTLDISSATVSLPATALSTLNATNLTSGTVPDARFPATLPASSGANLTNLNASNLSSGTVPNARLSGITRDKLDLISTASDASLVAKGTAGVTDGYIQLNCEQNSHGIKIKSPTHASGANYTLVMPPSLGTSNQVMKMNSGATALEFGTISGSVFGTALFHVKDERPLGTSGQTLTGNGNFQKRDINTIAINEVSGASLSSNVITLPSGTYFADGFMQSAGGTFNSEKGRIRNTTDGATLLVSNGGYSWTNDYVFAPLFFKGRFTISGTKNIEIQWIGGNGTKALEQIGMDIETYLSVCFWKIS